MLQGDGFTVQLNEPAFVAERRVKLLALDRQLIVDLLNGLPFEFVQLPVHDELPEGTRVVELFNDPCRRCLVAVVRHDSFAVVPADCEAPFIAVASQVVLKRRVVSEDFEVVR